MPPNLIYFRESSPGNILIHRTLVFLPLLSEKPVDFSETHFKHNFFIGHVSICKFQPGCKPHRLVFAMTHCHHMNYALYKVNYYSEKFRINLY